MTGDLTDHRLLVGTYGDSKKRAVFDGYEYGNLAAGWTLHTTGL